jgi:hypothetical protein
VPLSALYNIRLQALQWDLMKDSPKQGTLASLLATTMLKYNPAHETIKQLHPLVLAAKANSEDTPNWTQAMNGPDRDGYWVAMETEYYTLKVTMSCWEVVDCEEWMNVLPGTWAF